MISFEELSKKSKGQIRSNEELSQAFSHYFLEIVGREASFCCTFKDYFTLFNPKLVKMNKSEKYNVGYPKNHVLAYRANGRTYRMMAKDATDEFLEGFVKHHAEVYFPDVQNIITLIEKVAPKESAPKESAPKKTKSKKIKKDD